ncbi:MAG: ATP-binding protein [bacterium]
MTLSKDRQGRLETHSSGTPIPPDPVARFVFDESSEAIACVDLENRLTYWNRGAEELFGYTKEEVLGRHFSMLIPDGAIPDELERLAAGTEEGIIRRYETLRTSKDGRLLTIQLTRAVLRSPEGDPIGYAALIRDVTPLRELTAQVDKMERLTAMTKITASVAHEFRNPLGVLSLTADLLQETTRKILSSPDNQTAKREAVRIPSLVEDLQREVGRLSEIINHYLFLAHIQSPNISTVELDGYMKEIVSDLRRKIAGRPVEFRYLPSGSSCSIHIDATQIRRLFYNLLDNALDAMPEGGSITLQTRCHNSKIEMRFCDTGTGIASDRLHKVFEPFETSKPKGSGLGLYIVREIILAHGGHVAIESELDRGTAIIVHIPLARPGGEQNKRSSRSEEAGKSGNHVSAPHIDR